MKNNITVVGGLYREISPKSDFFRFRGRAALFLAEQNIDVKFITCATTLACKSFQASKRDLSLVIARLKLSIKKLNQIFLLNTVLIYLIH